MSTIQQYCSKTSQVLSLALDVRPITGQIQLQILISTYPSTLISGQIPSTYLPLDV
eukprot:Pgem_evm1s15312